MLRKRHGPEDANASDQRPWTPFFFFFWGEFAGEVIQHGSHEQRGDAVNNQYGLRWLIGGMALSRFILSLQSIGDLRVFSIKVYILIAKSISVAIVFWGPWILHSTL